MRLLTGHFVGRAGELGSFERLLDELGRGQPCAVEVAGEPGIGKTRLLRELAGRAAARGHLVLSGAASEFERDLPFSVFIDALDEYVAGLEPGRLAVLDDAVQAELAHVFPSLPVLGERFDVARAALLYQESGGNPFYLEQLARSPAYAPRSTSAPEISLAGIDVPAAVAASLAEELTLLSGAGRLVLEGAAVAGDPFEPELAAAAAATSEAAGMHAVDELLALDLIRATDVPRRFRFRHPLVRRAVYEATAGGWRLGAHERCAEALAARGASAAACAHHVQTAPAQDRVELLLARSRALAAAGRFTGSHEAALEAAALVQGQPGALGTTVATACASVERFLGRYARARARLVKALRLLPETASAERAELLIELTLNEFYRSRYEAMRDWAAPAVSAAKEAGVAALIAAAAVMPAFADAMTGQAHTARSRRDQAAVLVDELPDDDLSLRPDAAGWLAIAEVYLDLYAEADTHASRALRLARASGQGDPLHRLYPVVPRVWHVRGKLAEATVLLDGAIEAARLLGSPPALAGNLFNRSAVALAAGDLDIALATAQESVELTRDLDEGFVTAWAAARLADVLSETGQPGRAVELLHSRAGGEELTLIPGGWRAYWLELLTRCRLALDRPGEARRAAALAGATAAAAQLPLAATWAGRAAVVALDAGEAVLAAERALDSADAADAAGAPIEAALSRTVAGRALAQAGDRRAGTAGPAAGLERQMWLQSRGRPARTWCAAPRAR